MHWVYNIMPPVNTGSIMHNFSFLFRLFDILIDSCSDSCSDSSDELAELELANSKLIEDFDVFRFSSSSSTRYLFDLLTFIDFEELDPYWFPFDFLFPYVFFVFLDQPIFLYINYKDM